MTTVTGGQPGVASLLRVDALAPAAFRNSPPCDRPVATVTLLATQEAARPTVTNRVTDVVPL
ncbi:hypothetical protein [Streptomyces sp. R44]|uniref:Uncharacterized protein n=1 Tax=Streptomyces sp. R44 TaxID=3238633 RepID=A0AB39SLW4_9ACTN